MNRNDVIPRIASLDVWYTYNRIFKFDLKMGITKKTLRICEKGHKYYKSTDCPTCPTCEKEKKPSEGFLSRLSSPARNALLHYLEIDTLEKLSNYTEKEILDLHGMGKASMPILKEALEEKGLQFKDESETSNR